jgi:hypothetical protein
VYRLASWGGISQQQKHKDVFAPLHFKTHRPYYGKFSSMFHGEVPLRVTICEAVNHLQSKEK